MQVVTTTRVTFTADISPAKCHARDLFRVKIKNKKKKGQGFPSQ